MRTRLSGLISLVCAWLFLASVPVFGQGNARLSGTVTDSVLAPVKKVLVTLSSLDRVFQMESGTDGRFQFVDVPPGSYDLELSAEGFVKQKRPIDLSPGDTRSIAIVLKVLDSMPDMNYCGYRPSIEYGPSGTGRHELTGIIRDGSRPIARAKIDLSRVGENAPIVTVTSDRTGRFKVANPPPGRYTLRVSRKGYQESDLKELLITRENDVSIDVDLLRGNFVIVCQ